jgi:cytochrome c-type biogenesis protein CcmH/NrfG
MKRLPLIVGLTVVSTLVASDLRAQFGSVRGRVVDDGGQPVADARVVVETIAGQKFKLESKTKKDGAFHQVTTHTSGPWVVSVSKDGYNAWQSPGPLRIPLGGDTITLPDITLAKIRPSEAEIRSEQFKDATDLLMAAEAARQAGDGVTTQEKLDAAEAALQAFIEKNPEEAAAHFNLGLVRDHKQAWEKAAAAYLRAVELSPEMVDAAVGAGAALINARQPARAIEVLEGALAGHPDHTRLQGMLALARYNEGSQDQAMALFEKVRGAEPDNPEPYYYLGMIAVQQNRPADAVTLLEKYVSMNPPNPAELETAKGLIAALKKKE